MNKNLKTLKSLLMLAVIGLIRTVTIERVIRLMPMGQEVGTLRLTEERVEMLRPTGECICKDRFRVLDLLFNIEPDLYKWPLYPGGAKPYYEYSVHDGKIPMLDHSQDLKLLMTNPEDVNIFRQTRLYKIMSYIITYLDKLDKYAQDGYYYFSDSDGELYYQPTRLQTVIHPTNEYEVGLQKPDPTRSAYIADAQVELLLRDPQGDPHKQQCVRQRLDSLKQHKLNLPIFDNLIQIIQAGIQESLDVLREKQKELAEAVIYELGRLAKTGHYRWGNYDKNNDHSMMQMGYIRIFWQFADNTLKLRYRDPLGGEAVKVSFSIPLKLRKATKADRMPIIPVPYLVDGYKAGSLGKSCT